MAHDCVALSAQDFMRQGTGVICCYSLKNTRFPEYVFNTDAGVCCLEPRPHYERVCLGTSNAISHMHGRQDWHPAHPAVLAVGLYDGTVLVYDVRAKTKKPIYQSTVSRLPVSLWLVNRAARFEPPSTQTLPLGCRTSRVFEPYDR